MSAKEDEGAADGKELAAIIRRVTEEYGPIAGQDDCSSGLDQLVTVLHRPDQVDLVLKVPKNAHDKQLVVNEAAGCLLAAHAQRVSASPLHLPAPTLLLRHGPADTVPFMLQTCRPGRRLSDLWMRGEVSASAGVAITTDIGRVLGALHTASSLADIRGCGQIQDSDQLIPAAASAVAGSGAGAAEAAKGGGARLALVGSCPDIVAALKVLRSVLSTKEEGQPTASSDLVVVVKDVAACLRAHMCRHGLLSDAEGDDLVNFFDRCCEDGSVATAFTNLRPAVIHRDLDMDNIMVDLQAQAVTGMVDFGDIMIMPPYYDLAAMYARLFPMPGRLFRHVLKGYAETAPAPTGAKPGTAVHEGAVNMCTVLDLAPRAVRRKARGGRVDEAMVVVKAIIAQSTAGPQTIQHGSGGEEHK